MSLVVNIMGSKARQKRLSSIYLQRETNVDLVPEESDRGKQTSHDTRDLFVTSRHTTQTTHQNKALTSLRGDLVSAIDQGDFGEVRKCIQRAKSQQLDVTDKAVRDPGTETTVLHKCLLDKKYAVAKILFESSPELCTATYPFKFKGKTTKKNCLHILVDNMEEERDFKGDPNNKSCVEAMKEYLKELNKLSTSQKNSVLNEELYVEPSGQRPRTMPALQIAAMKGLNRAVRLMLDIGGMDANHQNSKNDTPILWAAKDGRTHTVELLLERGADPNLGNDKGSTPLHWAIRYNKVDTVEKLLESGKLNITPRKLGFETPLILAAALGYPEIIEKLMNYYQGIGKADSINEGLKSGNKTALHVAAYYGQCTSIRELCKKENRAQFRADHMGDTPLIYAIKGNQARAAELLLKYVLRHRDDEKIIIAEPFGLNKVGRNIWDFTLDSTDDDLLKHLTRTFLSMSSGGEEEGEQRAAIEFPSGKRTPMHVAASKGDVRRLNILKVGGVRCKIHEC